MKDFFSPEGGRSDAHERREATSEGVDALFELLLKQVYEYGTDAVVRLDPATNRISILIPPTGDQEAQEVVLRPNALVIEQHLREKEAATAAQRERKNRPILEILQTVEAFLRDRVSAPGGAEKKLSRSEYMEAQRLAPSLFLDQDAPPTEGYWIALREGASYRFISCNEQGFIISFWGPKLDE